MSQTFFNSSKRSAKHEVDEAVLQKKQKSDVSQDLDLEIKQDAVLQIMRRGPQRQLKGPVIVAGFDLDGTLITTKSGRTFAAHGHDWKLLPDVKERLAQKLGELPPEQVLFVIFTNQGGVLPQLSSKSFKILRAKLEGVANELSDIDLIFASLKITDPSKKKIYRKPGSGMFDILRRKYPEIDMERSFFVGDAAGRKQDHSADDRGFAANAQLKFYTPEEFFNVNDSEKRQEASDSANDAPASTSDTANHAPSGTKKADRIDGNTPADNAEAQDLADNKVAKDKAAKD